MSVTVRCANAACHQAIRVATTRAGQRVQCPACKQSVRVPARRGLALSTVLPWAATGGIGVLLFLVALVLLIARVGLRSIESEVAAKEERAHQAEQDAEAARGKIKRLTARLDAAAARSGKNGPLLAKLKQDFDTAEQKMPATTTDLEALSKALRAAEAKARAAAAAEQVLLARIAGGAPKVPGTGGPDVAKPGAEPAALPGRFDFQQYPPDGWWAEYRLKGHLTVLGTKDVDVEMKMRVGVGKTRHQGVECRWHESQEWVQPGGETKVTKVIFREDQGKTSPTILRVLVSDKGRPPEDVDKDSPETKAASLALWKELKDVKELDRCALPVDGLGMVACVREAGKVALPMPGFKDLADAMCWRSEQVPFNLVKAEMTVDLKQAQVKGTFRINLVAVGQGARSVIPDDLPVAVQPKGDAYVGRWVGGGADLKIKAGGDCQFVFEFKDAITVGSAGLTPKGRDYTFTLFTGNQNFNWTLSLADRNTLILEERSRKLVIRLKRQ